jgi:hypothetical protein
LEKKKKKKKMKIALMLLLVVIGHCATLGRKNLDDIVCKEFVDPFNDSAAACFHYRVYSCHIFSLSVLLDEQLVSTTYFDSQTREVLGTTVGCIYWHGTKCVACAYMWPRGATFQNSTVASSSSVDDDDALTVWSLRSAINLTMSCVHKDSVFMYDGNAVGNFSAAQVHDCHDDVCEPWLDESCSGANGRCDVASGRCQCNVGFVGNDCSEALDEYNEALYLKIGLGVGFVALLVVAAFGVWLYVRYRRRRRARSGHAALSDPSASWVGQLRDLLDSDDSDDDGDREHVAAVQSDDKDARDDDDVGNDSSALNMPTREAIIYNDVANASSSMFYEPAGLSNMTISSPGMLQIEDDHDASALNLPEQFLECPLSPPTLRSTPQRAPATARKLSMTDNDDDEVCIDELSTIEVIDPSNLQ